MVRLLAAAALLSLLSTPSMAQMKRGDGEGIFEKADANNDGSVTREEFTAARNDQFAKFDRNSDGFIDSSDVPKRLAARRAQNGGGSSDLLRTQFDSNGDGKVGKDEFVNGPTTLFERADTDSNNVLDPKELAAAKEAAKAAASEFRNRKQQ